MHEGRSQHPPMSEPKIRRSCALSELREPLSLQQNELVIVDLTDGPNPTTSCRFLNHNGIDGAQDPTYIVGAPLVAVRVAQNQRLLLRVYVLEGAVSIDGDEYPYAVMTISPNMTVFGFYPLVSQEELIFAKNISGTIGALFFATFAI